MKKLGLKEDTQHAQDHVGRKYQHQNLNLSLFDARARFYHILYVPIFKRDVNSSTLLNHYEECIPLQ